MSWTLTFVEPGNSLEVVRVPTCDVCLPYSRDHRHSFFLFSFSFFFRFLLRDISHLPSVSAIAPLLLVSVSFPGNSCVWLRKKDQKRAKKVKRQKKKERKTSCVVRTVTGREVIKWSSNGLLSHPSVCLRLDCGKSPD